MIVVSGRGELGGKDNGVLSFIIIRVDFAFLRSHSGTQESSVAEYSFYQIRKDHWGQEASVA